MSWPKAISNLKKKKFHQNDERVTLNQPFSLQHKSWVTKVIKSLTIPFLDLANHPRWHKMSEKCMEWMRTPKLLWKHDDVSMDRWGPLSTGQRQVNLGWRQGLCCLNSRTKDWVGRAVWNFPRRMGETVQDASIQTVKELIGIVETWRITAWGLFYYTWHFEV